MPTELTPDRIRELYDAFRAQNPWEQWDRDYLERVEHFQDLTEQALRSPQEQEALWRTRPIAPLGPGESVSTRGAYADAEIVDAFATLRSRRWPDDPGKRARAVQDAYDQLLELVHPRHSPQRPQAKLARAFAALLPHDTNACLNWQSHKHVTKLLLGSRKVDPLEGAVLVRARLRAVLGAEPDLAEHVRRATFCWWLHEHFDTVAAGDIPDTKPEATPMVEDVADKISIWAPSKQRKGMTSVGGFVGTFRTMVSAARGGASPDDVVETFRQEGHALAASSSRSVFNDVRWLELIEHVDGLWRPSEDGEQLLEEDPPGLLIERMLQRVFGMAWGLRILGEGPTTAKALGERLRPMYPSWTSDVMPSNLLGWLEGLGLAERESGWARRITPYGRAWLARLPDELPIPDRKDIVDAAEVEEVEVVEVTANTRWPTLAEVLAAFRSDPHLATFVFDDTQIRALHLAWHSHPRKRFVILSGLSGTGKTALLYHYARVYCDLVGRPVDSHRAVVAVSPDWRDPSGLLGYLNALHADQTFQAEPALRLVLAADRNPGLPYFLLLDEMNLARVERYFAPFLSAMETGDKLVLHANDEPVNGVPPRIPWPTNLFIGGTVNMDETTHAFSDKVLDRAFTMEFFEVDLERFLERRAARKGRRHTHVEDALRRLNASLRPIRRHFGYRTASEVLDFVDAAAEHGVTDAAALGAVLDQALFSKVLPRLRGEQTPPLEKAITDILAVCRDHDLPRCRDKLEVMEERLKNTGVTRFWS